MTIRLNGAPREVGDGITVADLVRSLGLEGRPVAVEVNRTLVTRAAHGTTTLNPDDRVEVVTLVGGG